MLPDFSTSIASSSVFDVRLNLQVGPFSGAVPRIQPECQRKGRRGAVLAGLDLIPGLVEGQAADFQAVYAYVVMEYARLQDVGYLFVAQRLVDECPSRRTA